MIALILFSKYSFEFCQFWLLCKIMASKSSIIEQEQRAYIKFRSLLKDSNRNIHNDLVEVCGDRALAYSTVRRWAQLYREGRESAEDETVRPKSAQVICQLSQFMNFYEVIPAVLLRRFLNILRSLREVFIVSSKKISELRKFVHDESRIHFRRPRLKIA